MSCDRLNQIIKLLLSQNKVLRRWLWTGWISSCRRGRTWWRRPPGPGWGGAGAGWWGEPPHYWRTATTRGASTLQSLKHFYLSCCHMGNIHPYYVKHPTNPTHDVCKTILTICYYMWVKVKHYLSFMRDFNNIPKVGWKFPHFPSTLNISIIRNRVLRMIYLVSYSSGGRKLNSVSVFILIL